MSAEVWAHHVHSDDPHGLDEVERQVLKGARATIRHAEKVRKRDAGKFQRNAPALILGPVLAALAFIDSEGSSRGFNFGPVFELSASFVGFLAGVLFQAHLLHKWRQYGRRRDSEAIMYSVLVLVCAVVTLWQGSSRQVGGAVIFLLPAMLTVLGGLATIAVNSFSQPSPGESGPEPVSLSELHDIERKALLADRNTALEVLQQRGMLERHSATELAYRPLGKLSEGIE